MTDENSVFQRLRARGEEVFSQVSGELMANPHFMKAVQGAHARARRSSTRRPPAR